MAISSEEHSTVNSKDIWQAEEVPESNVQILDEVDKRPQPE